jgi:hypothetical protein
MKAFFITAVVVLFSICGNSQTLRKELLTKNDKKNGILLKFNYSSNNVYGSISLILKADGTFSYNINTCITHAISEGRWKMIKDLLILESTFQMDNIPVEISNERTGSSLIVLILLL